MWNSRKILAIVPAIVLVGNGLIAQNKSSNEPVKPFDKTLKWELPYEAPADKIKKIQDGIKSIKLRMTYAQTVAKMGAPDGVYDLRQDFFALGPQEDNLLMSYRSNFSFRVIWYLSKTGTAPNLKDKWFALYLATDEKTVLARMANNVELPKAQ
jgi:hypothetical protein